MWSKIFWGIVLVVLDFLSSHAKEESSRGKHHHPYRRPRSRTRSNQTRYGRREPTVFTEREPYRSDWQQMSDAVRQRDGWTCRRCGWRAFGRGRYYLHAHHVVPRSQGGPDKPDNLISLCLECHAAQPGHHHLRYGYDYQRFLNLRYRQH